MIERVYLKECLTFKEVELNFETDKRGLIIFSGASGAGKSILMQAILSLFGYFEASAKLGEVLIDRSLDLSEYGIESDNLATIFKQLKREKVRYFINNQAVSKKLVKNISSNFVDYLSVKNSKEFKNENLLLTIDKFAKSDSSRVELLFERYRELKKEMKEIEEKEQKANELIEFLEFEIEKIERIAPKKGEFEELIELKKSLSKIEKLRELSLRVNTLFEYENSVNELLNLLEVENSFFNETMNELRGCVETAYQKMEFLESVDIEEVLKRLEDLQGLIKRFGSIEESLNYLDKKREELLRLKNISFEKKDLEKEMKQVEKELYREAELLSQKRKKGVIAFKNELNRFLKKLYLSPIEIELERGEINRLGIDYVKMNINSADIGQLSTGEFNRLKLAFLASRVEFDEGGKTIFLDEVDANLSGEESMSVAKVLKFLSKKYQIFAISHQPQLTSQADRHFYIWKEGSNSFIKELNRAERVREIARIISGKKPNREALNYAKQLLKERE